MASTSLVDRHITRARRRLFARDVAARVLQCWAGGLLLAALWFLLQPLLFSDIDAEWRWSVPGLVVSLATVAGIAWAWQSRTSRVDAALALDARFALKERVTTWLTLDDVTRQSPAGQALHADVEQKVQDLDLAKKFPLRVSWRVLLAPVAGAVVAAICLLIGPHLRIDSDSTGDIKSLVNAPEVQGPLDDLHKTAFRKPDDRPTSEEQKKIEEAWQKLLEKPRPESQEQVRERVQEMRALEDQVQKRIEAMQEQAAKLDKLKDHLKSLSRDSAAKKDDGQQDAPTDEFEDALAKGDFGKAADAIERLQKKLKNKDMKPDEQRELNRQLQALNDKLQRLAKFDDLREKLLRDLDPDLFSKEDIERELEALAREMPDLQDLAEMLKNAKDFMTKEELQKALKELGTLKGKLDKMKLTDEELKELEKNGAKLLAARLALLQALNIANGANHGGQGKGNDQGKGMGQGQASGKRPMGKDSDSKVLPARQKGVVDPTGEQKVTGFGPARFARVPAQRVDGVVRQTAQDAYQALERQRIPPEFSDTTRGYFQKLSGQK